MTPERRREIRRTPTSELITGLAIHAARVEMARACVVADPDDDDRHEAEAIARELDDRLPGTTAW